ncbi:hypothetical protein [Actinoplanes sp. NPDC048796]|uniref:hypothetical protein n=1 Tax=unclassified Actinoplanes TaxID=2626549 RepID=UPI00340B016B
MNPVTRALIGAVDWAALRTESGNGVGLPQAFDDLSKATSEAAADDAYWRIDNEAIVQGELYEAAVPTLEVLLSMASTMSPGPARRSLAELIQQITFGQPHGSEVELGNLNVATACKSLASGAIWIFYGWLTDTDSDVRECALLTLQKIDVDDRRKSVVLAELRDIDPSPGVQKIFSQIDQGLI